jgi:hypothetical protein
MEFYRSLWEVTPERQNTGLKTATTNVQKGKNTGLKTGHYKVNC